jgi:predicted RNA-binding protein with PUA-like domain
VAYWILQANPDVYRIFDALEDAEAIRTWTVAHHRQVVVPGDEFALWASGPKGGVCAIGVVTEPAQFRPDDLDPYWEGPAERNEPEWLIGIKVTDQIKPPIPRGEIAADPALASMPIIRMPGGGNPFPVNEAQWQAIRSHRRRQLGTGLDDDASGWPDGEIQPTLTAYFAMLRAELAGQSYVKTAFNREVQGATRRSRGAVEFKFANVSAVLREIGLPYVLGYQPRVNIQGALRPAVERFLASDTELARILEEMPAPDLPPTVELVEVDSPVMAPPGTTGRGRTTIGVDYLERQARNRDVGLKGELLVVEHEHAWLSAYGRFDLAELVIHVPGTLGDGAGYDVSSFLLDGSPHHIEVKATRGSIAAPFFLSANELRYALEHPGAYSIYRIFDLGPNPGFYKLTGNLAEILDLTPVSYQVRVVAPGAHSNAQS